jgi:hypothetical protein
MDRVHMHPSWGGRATTGSGVGTLPFMRSTLLFGHLTERGTIGMKLIDT